MPRNKRKPLYSRVYDHGFHDAVYIVPGRSPHLYYRYLCNGGRHVAYSLHIPGGNTNSPIATGRAIEVCRWMRRGESPTAIAALINTWSNAPA
ncbi:hypothetical protein HPC62_00040 [Thermoleptolyngbya sichuanensis A183]|uniref:Uncharacterized protein n=1 Tax=Thermoleptolyngbya sichuanensis A183 TaxID=2737172 RepID=A0A6M8B7U6_9CYAN|nr:hypothetical protein [Thermoleptolyngbya sichuanensis]QKD80777.1 hypothetical protein HPC62_00040 [Thermoleptolyngbya sichuanensis A183]